MRAVNTIFFIELLHWKFELRILLMFVPLDFCNWHNSVVGFWRFPYVSFVILFLFSYLVKFNVLFFSFIPHVSCLGEIHTICIFKLNMKTVLWTFMLILLSLYVTHWTCMLHLNGTCIFRYDGQRAQIHKLVDGSVRIFSRNGDETTSRFPDLVSVVRESCKPDALTFILDAEVLSSIMRCYFILRIELIYLFTWSLKNLYEQILRPTIK